MSFYTTKALSKRYNVEEADIRAVARLGIVPGIRHGNVWIFDADAVDILDELIDASNDDAAEDEQEFDDEDNDL